MDEFQAVLDAQSVPLNRGQAVDVGGEKILVCNADGVLYAVQNNCTHQDTPLQDGRIRGGHICCPLHGVRFELTTGEPKGTLTRIPLRTYPVMEKDGKIWINPVPVDRE